MSDYRVKLDIYSGPMDLLLYLIRRNEVDIHDIPVAEITKQYVEYVELIKQFDIDLAGEFLVMAATLMEVKSAMLLPRDTVESEEGGEDLSDPRLELVRQLLEYKKFKDVAGELDQAATIQENRFTRSQADIERLRESARQDQELDLESIQIWDLFDAFNSLMKATLANRYEHQVFQDDTPIDLYEVDILDRAQRQQPLRFASVFEGRSSKIELVGLFLAMLELIRQKLVRIEQEQTFGDIYLFPLTNDPAEQAVANAVSADIASLPSEINVDKGHKDEQLADLQGDPQLDSADTEALLDEDLNDDDSELKDDFVDQPLESSAVEDLPSDSALNDTTETTSTIDQQDPDTPKPVDSPTSDI